MSIKFESNLSGVKSAIREATENGLTALGMYIQDQAQRNIKKAKAIDTGLLRSRIDHKIDMNQKSVSVGTNVEYAVYVELGTGIYADGGGGRQSPWMYNYEGKKGKKGWRITSGSKPVHFLTDAFTKNHSQMKDVYQFAYDKKMKEYSK